MFCGRKTRPQYGKVRALVFTMTNDKEEGNWRKLCELAAKETDPERLYALVERLNRALEERARGMEGRVSDDGVPGDNPRRITSSSR